MPKKIYKKTDKGMEQVGILPSLTEWDGKVNKSGDTMSGNLSPSTTKGASLGTSSLYWNNIYGTTLYENGTSLANKYLGKTAKAADADKLDGNDSTYYLNLDNINDGSTRKLANYVPKSLTSAKGDIIYASAASTPARLGIGSNGQFLSVANGIPTWVNNPDTNTWRKVQLNGTDKLGTGTNTNPLNIKAGSNMTITESNGTFTFAARDTTYTFNGAVSTIKDSNLTASRALISNSSGKVAVSDVTSTELSYLDGVTSSIQTQLNRKSDKTAYEWNKEFAAGSNGAISLGRYNIYDSQLTFDITSTTNQSISGKLVIATQNGTIHQAKVFGDASGALVSKLIIYQSAISNSRSWVEVFCNFNGWSKNKVHIYAVALNSATVQKQMTSVAISNGVPAAANVTSGDAKWTGTIVNDFNHSHGNYVPYDNASKDVYLGSHGIYSGVRPSSGSATLAGNGYWIKPSSVGVSSSIIGGGTETSEMAPNYISVSNGKIKLNSSGIVSDSGTFKFDGNPGSVATSADLKNYQPKGNYVTTDTAQTITGKKTFNSPANENGKEVATAIFKTSNGGQLIIGKEGPNSGTMLRFDQTAGTTRLQFRASATPGAMVWTQPEKGATLYFDLKNSAGVSTRTTLDARNGTIARTSDIGNGKITIQKNGTEVGSFTTNQSGSKTINISLAKSDVGLGNVDNTADKDKSVKHASSAEDATNAFKLISEDKTTEYDYTDIFSIYGRVSALERYTKVYYVDTNITTSNSHGTPINSKFESNAEMISSDMSTNFNTHPTNQCIYADRIGDVTPNELKIGDIIVIDGYLSRYISDKTTVSTSSSGQASVIRVKFTAINKQYLDRINGKANVGHGHAISEITDLQSTLNGKQATLVSGTNIKTINGNSILGSGNLSLAMSIAQKSINNDIINATSTKSCYVVIENWLVQWGVFIGAYGDTTNWEVTFPKAYYWYPAVILQTKDTNTGNQGIPYSNGAVVTSNDGGASFTFQLRRSETCPVYWIAIGGLH